MADRSLEIDLPPGGRVLLRFGAFVTRDASHSATTLALDETEVARLRDVLNAVLDVRNRERGLTQARERLDRLLLSPKWKLRSDLWEEPASASSPEQAA